MADRPETLEAGLHFVSVPLGNARDITLRAIDILAKADILCAEDTRSLRRLMRIHNIARNGRRIFAYNDHNGARQRPHIVAHIQAGRSVAYAPEAGTPMIADPGFALGREIASQGYPVHHAPGPCAAVLALCASGFGTDRLYFAGFAPPRENARRRYLEELRDVNATSVIYEAPRRLTKLVAAVIEVFGEEHQVALCRELTKKFETIIRTDAKALHKILTEKEVKGECILVIERSVKGEKISEKTLKEELGKVLLRESLPNGTRIIAKRYGMARTEIYKMALDIKKRGA